MFGVCVQTCVKYILKSESRKYNSPSAPRQQSQCPKATAINMFHGLHMGKHLPGIVGMVRLASSIGHCIELPMGHSSGNSDHNNKYDLSSKHYALPPIPKTVLQSNTKSPFPW